MSWAGPHTETLGKTAHPVRMAERPLEPGRPLLLCLAHLRWSFVYQRPQHEMVRFAEHYNVLYCEEPLDAADAKAHLDVRVEENGVRVLVPRVPAGLSSEGRASAQRELLQTYLRELQMPVAVAWYFTPMALDYAGEIPAQTLVYDCMDELSAFRGAPPALLEREAQLLERADLVFTGGYSLYEAKRDRHPRVFPFPSSVDVAHFGQAREALPEPLDQADLARPRLGFYGVIDERLDLALLAAVARLRPHWQWVMLGPVVKIAPDSLPQSPNLHYLGGKTYDELPAYLAGWDVALMPFALNEATRFISPTKTPEYLAGGCPVVSTPITDVERSYGDSGVVWIAEGAEAFAAACEAALASRAERDAFLARADALLTGMSWDSTCDLMREKIQWR
ncbi:glycosyl transferase [Pseudomonas oryzihabitans]|nr:glycosyl transferase [Pseudomonas psychrotolerans]KTT22772.1 glycosyl transferase [Pseudomonas psychrotolerans]KTT60252.1 glycosyl transferase [Pseudomonas psychrotolerans]